MNDKFRSFLKEKNIQGVIFDMDGTLLDAMQPWFDVSRKLVIEMGRTPRPNFDQEMKAHEGKNVTDFLIKTYDLNCTPEYVSEYTINGVVDEYKNGVPAKPFAHELLKAFDQAGIPMCVCTGSFHALCDPAFERLGFDKYFKFTYTPEDVNGRRKQFPDIYLRAAEKLGVKPENCLVFEDTLLCLTTAHNAGFPTVGVYDSAAAAYEEDIKKLADIFVHSFEELF
ncbi:MAG: HAD family phosphatase [Oscillospiraceae bacterium]|nr:HAD family phosphatase [Oscillospiraceae bacterium]